jgi:DNA-directed RNA polymerase
MIPSEVPADIYQKVADNVILRLQKEENPFAKKWLDFGVDRSIAKRPTMTICYGSRQYSWTDFVNEIVQKRKEKGRMHPFGGELLKACSYLAKIMWQVASDVIEAASKVMKWLQDVARIASSEGIPIVWYTPMGFPVQQAYENYKPLQIQTKLMGKVFRPQLKVSNDNLNSKWDKRKQAAGVSPNWVHALDSCHLQMTLCTAFAEGIKDFAMVHDSYGTLAADVERLGECCRATFVDIYKSHDVLMDFRNDIISMLPESKKNEVPMPPKKGDLIIDQVLESEFFFS